MRTQNVIIRTTIVPSILPTYNLSRNEILTWSETILNFIMFHENCLFSFCALAHRVRSFTR